jgi:hemoglobin
MNVLNDISNRKDIKLLVDTFYDRIRTDELLGPIFNSTIPEDHWAVHLEKLADFWEANIFGIPKFNGNPVEAHRRLDKKMNHTISQEHFGHWLHLWFSTIDQLFEGENALKAKNRARNMATGQYLKIWEVRDQK